MNHFLSMFRVCQAILSGYGSPVVTCWERADLLDHLYVMLYCVFVTFLSHLALRTEQKPTSMGEILKCI